MLTQTCPHATTTSFEIASILHRQRAHDQYTAIICSFLTSYFKEQVQANLIDCKQSENLQNISWLCFGYKGHKFSIGLQNDWSSAVGLQSLLEWLHSDLPQDKIKFASALSLEGTNPNQADSSILKFNCLSGTQNFEAWLSVESKCQLPKISAKFSKQIEIKLNCYIALGSGQILGEFSLVNAELICFPSSLASGLSPTFCAVLNPRNSMQILKLEEYLMADNMKIKTMLRLGALELELDDFLSLKNGSEITFSLPEKTAVELELGGHIVGRGELKMGENGFTLGITEAINAPKLLD